MTLSNDDPRLTAYALGELDETARAQVEAALGKDPALAAEVDAIRALAGELEAGFARESVPSLSDAQRHAIARASTGEPAASASRGGTGVIVRITRVAVAAVVLVAVAGWWLDLSFVREARRWILGPHVPDHVPPEVAMNERGSGPRRDGFALEPPESMAHLGDGGSTTRRLGYASHTHTEPVETQLVDPASLPNQNGAAETAATAGVMDSLQNVRDTSESGDEAELAKSVQADFTDELERLGYIGNEARLSGRGRKVAAVPAATPAITAPSAPPSVDAIAGLAAEAPADIRILPGEDGPSPWRYHRHIDPRVQAGGEGYDPIVERSFEDPRRAPLSTFSIDVDTASYANVRRFLNQGAWPPKDAVRIEEMINYFDYDYAPPTGEHPFATHVEVMPAPWAPQHRLVRVALQGRAIDEGERVGGNLVFLVDVSGSMSSADKLPLVQSSLKLLLDQLDERDTVALVTYAGHTCVALEATACTPDGKRALRDAIDGLSSSGSTAGAAGIELAYAEATRHFVRDGVNRVILATDGDFNVGITDKTQLESLIAEKARSGVFLTVLLYGTGNVKDDVAERLSNRGNGNYAYIDTLNEAHKVLVEQIGGTLVTIAKDVKIQVEFNPTRVGAYRLIGYENRALAARDFRDDSKDAGEIGAGHSVTALYEIVPAQIGGVPGIPPLRYQEAPDAPTDLSEAASSDELLYVRVRYKRPDGEVGIELGAPVVDDGRTLDEAGADALFASAVAEFGMLLRESPDRGDASFEGVIARAQAGRGRDESGYRAEFIRLVRVAQGLKGM